MRATSDGTNEKADLDGTAESNTLRSPSDSAVESESTPDELAVPPLLTALVVRFRIDIGLEEETRVLSLDCFLEGVIGAFLLGDSAAIADGCKKPHSAVKSPSPCSPGLCCETSADGAAGTNDWFVNSGLVGVCKRSITAVKSQVEESSDDGMEVTGVKY